ncbi:hypothetical protein [Chelativorans sp. M5D2P16]|uniref:hypothetical protein n=1 Tax=Chelativorans sp. M5D2P16 TaxID=3095678 RepID=UPI002ACA8AB8|nr:hypothetical protein [Chelativorans sp. M5D2P16]MDZ5698973.1 hypothetical protein [Chelativorans sp. M5D2P16]
MRVRPLRPRGRIVFLLSSIDHQAFFGCASIDVQKRDWEGHDAVWSSKRLKPQWLQAQWRPGQAAHLPCTTAGGSLKELTGLPTILVVLSILMPMRAVTAVQPRSGGYALIADRSSG